MLTAERLRELLRYDQETGVFARRISTGRHGRWNAGTGAGYLDSSTGYLKIWVDGTRYYAHRLAWLYAYGKWPENQIDHIDRCKSNNRIANLRLASNSQQTINTGLRADKVSGVRGVRWNYHARKWTAQIQVNRQTKHLGCFATMDKAAAAYAAAAANLHGEFSGEGVLRAGRLDRRIAIQRKVVTLSASGSSTESWSNSCDALGIRGAGQRR